VEGGVSASLEDMVMPPEDVKRPRAKFTGDWFRHSEMVTWHYYDAAFSWSLCRGDYAYSLTNMQRDDGSSPYCCTGCVIELAKGRAA